MLGNKAFYHSTIRKYVIAFAKIFGDVSIFKFENQDMKVYKEYHVPILYQYKSKLYQIKQANQPNFGVSNVYPRMTFSIKSAIFDEDRVENKYNKIESCELDEAERLKRIYTSRPYNFRFSLNIFTRNEDDKLMIIEQILSFFCPELVIPIIEVPEIGLKKDIKFEIDDEVDFGFDDENLDLYGIDEDYSTVTIGFTCYGNIYPPVKSEAIIKKLILEFGLDTENVSDDSIFEEIIINLEGENSDGTGI
jgi:hypothetical protein